jgi:BirA family biotin operon repressor/biotin-[acetyl-CoA-carboxylase] ligase
MGILSILSSKEYISGQKIAGYLGVSRAAVHKQILKLKKQGYIIKGHKNLGYLLSSKPDLITPEELNLILGENFIFTRQVIYREEFVSTQIAAKKLAEDKLGEGTLVICERQTGAYGRLQRPWAAPQGGLWFSLILRPNILPDKVPQITLAMSIAITRVLKREFRVEPLIKWPNDIIVNNKKLCGILTEMSAEVGNTNWVVVGVGLNVNNKIPKNLKNTAVSLQEVSGKEINRPKLLSDILTNFSIVYDDLCKKGFADFQDEYDSYAYLTGKQIKVKTANAIITGIAKGVDSDGYLLIKTSNNGIFKVISGDAAIVK